MVMKLHFRTLKDDDDVTNKEVTLTQFLWVLCAQTQNMFDLASGTSHNLSLRGVEDWSLSTKILIRIYLYQFIIRDAQK